jgi:hypothetical protein
MRKEIVPPVPQRAERRLLRHEWQTARESNLPEVTTVRSQGQYHQASSKKPNKCAVLPLDPLGMGEFLHKYVEHASRSSEICFWLYLAGLCGCCPLSSQKFRQKHTCRRLPIRLASRACTGGVLLINDRSACAAESHA